MMTWFFLRKSREMLSRLVAVLMIVLAIQCLKDLFFIVPYEETESRIWMIMTSIDMMAVPLYAYILIELCSPGTLNLKTIILHELLFVALPILFIFTNNILFYYADVLLAAIYGFGYALWTVIRIPKYHKLLRQRFSYDENINLNWLRYILISFFVILSLWIIDCLIINLNIEAIYMSGSLAIWMFISYFLYRHGSVIDELAEPNPIEAVLSTVENDPPRLKEKILILFEKDKIYLNPKLRLSDVASMVGSNRTYVSRIFNDCHGKTFFEYVNEYRVRHAMDILKSSDKKIEEIAEISGFSSRQSFHRVFNKITRLTPEEYRAI